MSHFSEGSFNRISQKMESRGKGKDISRFSESIRTDENTRRWAVEQDAETSV
jgi:hypothetical protein